MRTAIVRRDHLDVLDAVAPVPVVVFDSDIWEMHLVVEVRQAAVARPVLDLLVVTVGSAIAVWPVPIALLEERLVLAFQLVVEDDPM